MPVIAISDKPGAGSSTAGELLAKTLKLRFFSVGSSIKDKENAQNEAEAAISFWEHSGRSKETHEEWDQLQVKEAKKGNVVIDGKLTIHFLRDIAHFKVWLACPLEIRARRYTERDNIDEPAALKLINEKEALEQKRWKEMYDIEVYDQEFGADMVIDTSKKHPEQVVRDIIEGMKKLGIEV